MNQSPALFENSKIVAEKESDIKDLVAYALNKSKILGADQAEIGASWHQGLSVTVRLGDVETMEFNRDQSFAVTVYFNQAKGSASTNDLSRTAIDETIKAACNIAKFTSVDSYAGLADKELMANFFPDLDIYHPWTLTMDQAIKLANECEEAARANPAISNSDGASLNSHQSCRVYGNSHQFIGSQIGTRHSMSCMVLAKNQHEMQRDYWYDASRDANDLLSAKRIGEIAAERTMKRLGVQPIKTQHAPVLFSAPVAGGLIGHLISAISGNNLYKRSSFLLDHLHQQILPNEMILIEEPHRVKGMASVAFDGDGVATKKKYIVKDGRLESYILGSYSARKLGMQSTGNAGGVHNISLKSNETYSFDELVNNMHTGLIVTELMGHGTNIVTGDYSRGAAGFWVENGEIQFPVQGITIAGNLKDMLLQIQALGDDVDHRGNIQTGSILLDKIAIAGN